MLAQEKAESTIKKTNIKINELGNHTADLYNTLNNIQEQFDESVMFQLRNACNMKN